MGVKKRNITFKTFCSNVPKQVARFTVVLHAYAYNRFFFPEFPLFSSLRIVPRELKDNAYTK